MRFLLMKKLCLYLVLFLFTPCAIAFQWNVLCSSFFISNTGLIGTAAHCIAPGYKYFVDYKNTEYPVKVLAVDRIHDAAVVQAPIVGNRFLLLETQQPYVSEKVFLFGYPVPEWVGYDLKYQEGHMTSNTDAQLMLTLDTGVSCAGNSGGPLLNSAGRVIGILVAGLEGDPEIPCSYIAFATRIFYLEKLVEKLHLNTNQFTYTESNLPINSDEVVILYGRQ